MLLVLVGGIKDSKMIWLLEDCAKLVIRNDPLDIQIISFKKQWEMMKNLLK